MDDDLRRELATSRQRTAHFQKLYETALDEVETVRAGLKAPDDIIYNLVWVAARNEHTRNWLASQGLVVMEQAAYDAGLADLRRERGEADLRAEKAEAAIDRVRTVHRIHWCAVDGHKLDRTPNPCVNNGICRCGQRNQCPTLTALDSPKDATND